MTLTTRLRALTSRQRRALAEALPVELDLLRWHWPLIARKAQLPPSGNWRTWLVMGGRGSGKTRAGAEWVRSQAEGSTPLAAGRCRRIALVAETAEQASDVMVLGESGLMAISPPDRRPVFHLTRKRLTWPNGAEAFLFSALDPERLRGPQFDAAWCDELAKWRRAREAWDMLQFGLRLGAKPRQVVTTTPRADATLVSLLDDPGTMVSRMTTQENARNLAPGFLKEMEMRYAGRLLGRQELLGELVLEKPDALWSRALVEASRMDAEPVLDRVVVAVDPPVTSHAGSDACGIVVAGLDMSAGIAIVLADWSIGRASPQTWAARAVAAYHSHNADRMVAEVNQGGDMVETIVRQIDHSISYRPVRATRGKALRAEPVAALYEQGRVKHQVGRDAGSLSKLEDQMCAFSPAASKKDGSPDRVDALVWAITDLLLTPPRAEPKMRLL